MLMWPTAVQNRYLGLWATIMALVGASNVDIVLCAFSHRCSVDFAPSWTPEVRRS